MSWKTPIVPGEIITADMWNAIPPGGAGICYSGQGYRHLATEPAESLDSSVLSTAAALAVAVGVSQKKPTRRELLTLGLAKRKR